MRKELNVINTCIETLVNNTTKTKGIIKAKEKDQIIKRQNWKENIKQLSIALKDELNKLINHLKRDLN